MPDGLDGDGNEGAPLELEELGDGFDGELLGLLGLLGLL